MSCKEKTVNIVINGIIAEIGDKIINDKTTDIITVVKCFNTLSSDKLFNGEKENE